MPPKPPKPEPNDADIRSLTFEQAVEQLESIIDRIESGEIGLEDSLKQYERGTRLRDHCREILARTEQRVTELTPQKPDDAAP
ncbi:MAG: exodeoxyribonuclease VII small subunit [Phycisphaerae bacterium]|nr:exodeoxyribonuclease VII small subunit [Phycisphaerae bacterium]